MKKEILVGILAIGFVFAGVVSASAAAVTWQLVEHSSYAGTSPDSGGLLCRGGGGSNSCNFDTSVNCIGAGSPTVGACSYAELTFQMASSCAAGNTGQSCTQNTDCGSTLTPCVPCSPNPGVTFFGSRTDTAKGAGTYVANSCEDGYDITKLNIATSEVVTNVGGSCMTLNAFNSSSGCDAGATSMDYDVKLWTSTIGTCGFPAGTMPGLALSGQIMAVGAETAACGYTSTQAGNIASTVGLGSGDYLSIVCGSGTLPTDLLTVCIPGAPWEAVIVASTSSDLSTICPAACGGGCMGATAEGVE
jgi:hypothetical protein